MESYEPELKINNDNQTCNPDRDYQMLNEKSVTTMEWRNRLNVTTTTDGKLQARIQDQQQQSNPQSWQGLSVVERDDVSKDSGTTQSFQRHHDHCWRFRARIQDQQEWQSRNLQSWQGLSVVEWEVSDNDGGRNETKVRCWWCSGVLHVKETIENETGVIWSKQNESEYTSGTGFQDL